MYIYTKFILKLYNVLGTNPSQNVRVHGHDQVGFCPNGIISKESFMIDRECPDLLQSGVYSGFCSRGNIMLIEFFSLC